MDDREIILLYRNRDEQAIQATAAKYGAYCTSIAQNILGNPEDAEECVNETFWKTWESIPPHNPAVLSAFLGKVTRNLSINRFRRSHAEKRGSGQLPLVLDELSGYVSDQGDVEQALDRKELINALNGFLSTLSPDKRSIFVCRYWYFDSIRQIALRFSMTENHVRVCLSRLRSRLRTYLSERGFDL